MPKRLFLLLLICFFGFAAIDTARANVGYVQDSKAIPVIIAAVAVVVVIAFAIHYAVHRGRSLKGCASLGPGGIQLLNEGDQQTYSLAGKLDGIQAGARVHVEGKKQKDAHPPQFAVSKLSKVYGPCGVHP